jgi:hypothetical protein
MKTDLKKMIQEVMKEETEKEEGRRLALDTVIRLQREVFPSLSDEALRSFGAFMCQFFNAYK